MCDLTLDVECFIDLSISEFCDQDSIKNMLSQYSSNSRSCIHFYIDSSFCSVDSSAFYQDSQYLCSPSSASSTYAADSLRLYDNPVMCSTPKKGIVKIPSIQILFTKLFVTVKKQNLHV